MVSSEVLAENICTNPARVRKVMAKLKRAGLVTTREGLDGGYLFNGPADKVTLSMLRRRWRPGLFLPPGRAGTRIWTALWLRGWPAFLTEFTISWIATAMKGGKTDN